MNLGRAWLAACFPALPQRALNDYEAAGQAGQVPERKLKVLFSEDLW